MKKHLSLVFEKHDYPLEARDFLLTTVDRLYKNSKFVYLVENFYKDNLTNQDHIIPTLKDIINESGLCEHTVNYLYYLCVTKELREEYAKRGLPEDIYWDSVNDFRYKLDEGKNTLGVWGFHQSPWFYHFLRMTQFKLGRLEFTINDNYWNFSCEVDGITVDEGDPVIHVHIPSAKEPFTKEACYDSYDRAYRFFKETMHYDYKCFCCESWLLFPEHKKMLSEKSNISRFLDDFKIVNVKICKNRSHDLWRIFGADADLPYDQLPKDTSLKKAYAEYLTAGNQVGEGFGVFVWDPVAKKPITK